MLPEDVFPEGLVKLQAIVINSPAGKPTVAKLTLCTGFCAGAAIAGVAAVSIMAITAKMVPSFLTFIFIIPPYAFRLAMEGEEKGQGKW